MHFELPEDQRMIKDLVARFVREEPIPLEPAVLAREASGGGNSLSEDERAQVDRRSRELGLDPAYVYGLIRQESRFIVDARSIVGASGLMQLMPATARWTARKIGLTNYQADLIVDPALNLRLGTSYLKYVLDDFGGSLAMAAAAYNAGPSRSRKWREGPVLEPAVWAENIPFNETRDYVKKVLSNSAFYAARLSERPVSLKERLGDAIGPRLAEAPAVDGELP